MVVRSFANVHDLECADECTEKSCCGVHSIARCFVSHLLSSVSDETAYGVSSASIATIVRLKYLAVLANNDDGLCMCNLDLFISNSNRNTLDAGTAAMIWTLIEPGIAIIAASLVTLRPLLRVIKLKGFESDNIYPSHRSARQNISLRTDVPMENWTNSISVRPYIESIGGRVNTQQSGAKITDDARAQERAVSDNGSEEYILQGLDKQSRSKGIKRTVDFTVSRTNDTS